MQDTDPTPASSLAHLDAWLRLNDARGVGPRAAQRLLAAFGTPQAIFDASPGALAAHVGPALARSLGAPPGAETRARTAATRAWLAIPGNRLLALGAPGYPPALQQIPDPPLLLYASGRVELLARPALAIVGSRNATGQGQANARAFAAALAAAGVCVVSGLALGIDAAAHEGALRGPGSTIAVVGTGVDLAYPPRHQGLAERIARHGCLLSEYPLGTPPLSANFPRRNRIISGLACGVLVVEAAARSGSLITARLAADQGRDVFALPGSIHAPLAKGCHKLIRDGARLVDTVDDILEALQLSPLMQVPAGPCAALPTETDCSGLLAQLGHEALTLDDLLERSGSSIGELSMRLLALEMAGMIERLPGGKVQRLHG